MFWSIVAVFSLFSLWLARGLVKRQLGTTRGKKAVIVYWFLVIFALNLLFFPFVYWLGSMAVTQLTGKAYQAEIVSYLSEEDTCEDDGERYSCTMHTPVFAFTLEDGRRLELSGDIRSTAEPDVGAMVSVLYAEGASRVNERSMRSIGLLIGGGIMLMVEGYFILLILVYVLGYDISKVRAWGISATVNGLLPLGALFMFSALGYALYSYLFLGNPDDHPLWVALLCGFFMFCLLPAFGLYLKVLFAFLFGRKH